MGGEQLPLQPQVFGNFRGKELRYNFIGHLEKNLKESGINFFIDSDERKGEKISHLLKRIEESRVALVVFSRKYTESTCCLNELVKISERVDLGMLKVLPIFFKIDIENVKQLTGEFGDHFRRQEWNYRSEKPKIEKWKAALKSISARIGLTLTKTSSETEFIELINKEVMNLLARIPATPQIHHYQANYQIPSEGGTYSARSSFSELPEDSMRRYSVRKDANLLTSRSYISVKSSSSSSMFSDNYSSVCSYSVVTSTNGGSVSTTSRVWSPNPEIGTNTSHFNIYNMDAQWP